jgi:hypothetical protein
LRPWPPSITFGYIQTCAVVVVEGATLGLFERRDSMEFFRDLAADQFERHTRSPTMPRPSTRSASNPSKPCSASSKAPSASGASTYAAVASPPTSAFQHTELQQALAL